LIADDSPSSRELLRSILDGCGYDVAEVVDGSQVLAYATAFEPHLMILDVQMPMLDGCTSAILLRSQPAFEKIPIIALTAAVSDISADRIAEAGFTMHLVKPIGPARLRRCVAGLLERVP
jgi:CheY-like chemotaxis protein